MSVDSIRRFASCLLWLWASLLELAGGPDTKVIIYMLTALLVRP